VERNDIARSRPRSASLDREQDETIGLYADLAAEEIEVLGHLHPTTLATRNKLALACLMNGMHDEAITLLTSILIDESEVHGYAHRTAIAARHNLALACSVVGMHDEAIALHESTLNDARGTGCDAGFVELIAGNLGQAVIDRDRSVTARRG
jgi:hypothetical protein